MERLHALIEDLSRSGLDHIVWCGSLVAGQGIEMLLNRLPEKPSSNEIQAVTRQDAAAWLGLLATQSLTHGIGHGMGRDDARLLWKKAQLALDDLSPGAEFFAVGVWEISRRLKHWERLHADGPWVDRRYSVHFSGSYVAGRGVLGAVMAFDQKAAFLFAVIEDD